MDLDYLEEIRKSWFTLYTGSLWEILFSYLGMLWYSQLSSYTCGKDSLHVANDKFIGCLWLNIEFLTDNYYKG